MSSKAGCLLMACAFAMAGTASAVLASDSQIRKERVAFEKGASSATIRGSVKGDETVDYLLNARAGQKI